MVCTSFAFGNLVSSQEGILKFGSGDSTVEATLVLITDIQCPQVNSIHGKDASALGICQLLYFSTVNVSQSYNLVQVSFSVIIHC